jgi:hypothetical protein
MVSQTPQAICNIQECVADDVAEEVEVGDEREEAVVDEEANVGVGVHHAMPSGRGVLSGW